MNRSILIVICDFLLVSLVYRNPLEFENGPYSAKAIERRTQSAGNPRHPGSGNPIVAGMHFLLPTTTDIKTGLGGLRDVEFLAQGLQLVHAHENPGLLCGGTLPALKALSAAGILSTETADQLSVDYIFLRRVEHFLQIYEDRQTHSLPRDPSQLRALARLMLGSGATSDSRRE